MAWWDPQNSWESLQRSMRDRLCPSNCMTFRLVVLPDCFTKDQIKTWGKGRGREGEGRRGGRKKMKVCRIGRAPVIV